MPTSLTYIVLSLEAVHLGDLLRIWVRPGVKITPSPQDFQGTTGAHRTPPGSAVLYGNNVHISGQTDSMESVPYKEKRTLPGAPADVSWFVCVAALDPRTRDQSPRPGSGILTRFPFDRQRATQHSFVSYTLPPFQNRVFLFLRAD